MYLSFMSEDLQVWVKKDSIIRIENVGDRITIVDHHGEKTYEYVMAVGWVDHPNITWPDEMVARFMKEGEEGE